MNDTRRALADNAVAIAREAGKLLMAELPLGRYRGEIEDKGGGELVTRVDRASEALIRELVADAYPDHAVLGEEGGEGKGGEGKGGEGKGAEGKGGETRNGAQGDGGYRWIVDPLDGTTNFVHGHPFFAVSIAVEHQGQIVAAAVHLPYFSETYFAARGEGAHLNTRQIVMRTSETASLDDALVATGFAYDRVRYPNYENFVRIARETRGIRRCGAAAIDLAFVACGRYDAFWELGLKAWDVAAGALLVLEAGGEVSDFAGRGGEGGWLDAGNIVAANAHLGEALRGALDPPPHLEKT